MSNAAPCYIHPLSAISMSPRIAIVGAGLSGLSAARHLAAATVPYSLDIFEKSRSLSGRCATKTNFNTSPLDHGAPYFTLSPSVQSLLPHLTPHLSVLPPDALQTPSFQPIPQSTPLYYHPEGNSKLGSVIFPDADVIRALVKRVHEDGRIEILRHENNVVETVGPFDAVILTAPLPQAADILRVPEPVERQWKEKFVPTLTALLEYDLGDVASKSPLHAAARGQGPFAIVGDTVWAGCDTFKRKGEGDRVVVVGHAGVAFSEDLLEEDGEVWLGKVRREVDDLWRVGEGGFVRGFAKRWRYARVGGEGVKEDDWFGGRVLLAGDGVGGGVVCGDDVERAILSGFRAAEKAIGILGG